MPQLLHSLVFLLLTTFLINPEVRIVVGLSLADFLIAFMMILTVVNLINMIKRRDYCRFVIDTYQDRGDIMYQQEGRLYSSSERQYKMYRDFTKKNIDFGFIFFVLLFWMFIIISYSFLLGNEYRAVFGRFRNLFVYTLPFFAGMSAVRHPRDVRVYITIFKIFICLSIAIGTIHIVHPIPALIDPLIEQEQHYHMVLRDGLGLISILAFADAVFSYILGHNRFLNLLTALACAFATIASQNRTIIICYGLAMVLILTISPKNPKIWLRSFKIGCAIILLVTISLAGLKQSSHWDKFEKRYNRIVKELSGEQRGISQGERRIGRTIGTLRHWWDTNPLMGSGWGSQATQYQIRNFKGTLTQTASGTPHNYYAALLDQIGLIGTLMVMFLFWQIFRAIVPGTRLNKDSVSSYSIVIFFLIALVFISAQTYMYGSVTFISSVYFLFGIGVGNSIIYNHYKTHRGNMPSTHQYHP